MEYLIEGLKKKIAPWYKNLRGWRTDRKIVVIESDDWGSIRMPSRDVYEKCLKAGYRVDSNPFEMYDSLASEDDLELLFELLTSFRDCKGKHPVFTANSMVANPDFDKIEACDFQEYHCESIQKTFQSYPKHQNCLDLWKNGIGEDIFFPQSHGREHLNVSQFMDALRRNDNDVLFGFKNKIPGSVPRGVNGGGNEYVIAMKYFDEEDKKNKKLIFEDGLLRFESIFGYQSESFIPPNYWWSPDFNQAAAEKGVEFFQGNRIMLEPDLKGGIIKNRYHLGYTNAHGQLYLTRNVLFEPALFRMNIEKPLDHCLKSVDIAFKMNKPAIICSHRVNYVGHINKKNRDQNLLLLKELLGTICEKWPNAEFMTSVELGKIISSDIKSE